MFDDTELTDKFNKVADLGPFFRGEHNACHILRCRTGSSFEYVIDAMEQYYKDAPTGTQSQILGSLHKWAYWLEAVFYRFLLSGNLHIDLRYSNASSNPDFFIVRDGKPDLILDCKYKECWTKQDTIVINNINKMSTAVRQLQLESSIFVVTEFDGNHELTEKEVTTVCTFIQDICSKVHLDTDEVYIPFPAGECFIERNRSNPDVSSLRWRGVDCETEVTIKKNWITEVKKQHRTLKGELVGCFFVDTGMFTKKVPIEHLEEFFHKQKTVNMLIMFTGAHPADIATKGVTIISRQATYTSVLPHDLHRYLT